VIPAAKTTIVPVHFFRSGIPALLMLTLLFSLVHIRAGRGKEFSMSKQPVRILAFGDSLTAGWGVVPPSSVPACLETALREKGIAVTFINAGIPGDTTAGAIKRFEAALACDPDMVILELGANDNLQAIPTDRTAANLDAMLQVLSQRNIPTLLAGICLLRDLGAEYNAGFQALFEELATLYEAVFYPDYLAGVAGNPEYLQRDGLHPNLRGTQEIARRLLPVVTDMLANFGEPGADKLQP
jgi:acyl-CoA thioesterase-1